MCGEFKKQNINAVNILQVSCYNAHVKASSSIWKTAVKLKKYIQNIVMLKASIRPYFKIVKFQLRYLQLLIIFSTFHVRFVFYDKFQFYH